MPLPDSLVGDQWTQRAARIALPILVDYAKNGRTITYGQLDEEVRKYGLQHVHVANYGKVGGAIGSALIETSEELNINIPPINTIIVNSKTGLPGNGVNYFIEQYRDNFLNIDELDEEDLNTVIKEIQEEVFTYSHWDKLLKRYGLEPIAQEYNTVQQNANIRNKIIVGRSNEGESEEHKKLKNYIAENPHLVGLPQDSQKGETEYLFLSADKADIVFTTERGYLGVEVKSIISNESDIIRGIFQVVKYQALLRAEQKSNKMSPTAKAVLVVETELPKSLKKIAYMLGVDVFIIPVNH